VRWRPTVEGATREDPDMAKMLSHEYSPKMPQAHRRVYCVDRFHTCSLYVIYFRL